VRHWLSPASRHSGDRQAVQGLPDDAAERLACLNAATVMPRDEIMAWCYIALMSLAIAGVLTYKWTRPPCHTAFSQGGPFCEQMFAIKYIALLRLHSATKQ
jgi:hypothetical protein